MINYSLNFFIASMFEKIIVEQISELRRVKTAASDKMTLTSETVGNLMCYETNTTVLIVIYFFDKKMHFNAYKIFSVISSCFTLLPVVMSFTITWLLP